MLSIINMEAFNIDFVILFLWETLFTKHCLK